MALKEKFLDEDTMDVLKDSFDNVKIKAGMPTNIPEKKIVIHRAHRIFSNCRTVELKESSHLHILPQTEKERIIEFLRKG